MQQVALSSSPLPTEVEDLEAKLLRMNLEEFSLMTSDNSSDDEAVDNYVKSSGDNTEKYAGSSGIIADGEEEQDEDKLW